MDDTMTLVISLGVLVAGIIGYVFNMLRERIATQEVMLEDFRKRFHEFNNNTAEVIAEMGFNVGRLQKDTDANKEALYDLKEEDKETRLVLNKIFKIVNDLDKRQALAEQRAEDTKP